MLRFAVQREYDEQDVANKISERPSSTETNAGEPAFRLAKGTTLGRGSAKVNREGRVDFDGAISHLVDNVGPFTF